MNGQYKTPTGELLRIISFDEVNKMVYIENNVGQNKWFHENEYSTWESTAPKEAEPDKYEFTYGEPIMLISKEKELKVNKKQKGKK